MSNLPAWFGFELVTTTEEASTTADVSTAETTTDVASTTVEDTTTSIDTTTEAVVTTTDVPTTTEEASTTEETTMADITTTQVTTTEEASTTPDATTVETTSDVASTTEEETTTSIETTTEAVVTTTDVPTTTEEASTTEETTMADITTTQEVTTTEEASTTADVSTAETTTDVASTTEEDTTTSIDTTTEAVVTTTDVPTTTEEASTTEETTMADITTTQEVTTTEEASTTADVSTAETTTDVASTTVEDTTTSIDTTTEAVVTTTDVPTTTEEASTTEETTTADITTTQEVTTTEEASTTADVSTAETTTDVASTTVEDTTTSIDTTTEAVVTTTDVPTTTEEASTTEETTMADITTTEVTTTEEDSTTPDVTTVETTSDVASTTEEETTTSIETTTEAVETTTDVQTTTAEATTTVETTTEHITTTEGSISTPRPSTELPTTTLFVTTTPVFTTTTAMPSTTVTTQVTSVTTPGTTMALTTQIICVVNATCNPECENGGTCIQCGSDDPTCQCPSNWQGSSCSHDVDECVSGSHDCHRLASCTNTIGSYICLCPIVGFRGNGTYCEDIDECDEGLDACFGGATCQNTEGSYTCECPTGVENCTDVDECALGLDDCEQLCNNTLGSFVCSCREGFILEEDEKRCEPEDRCVKTCENGKCYLDGDRQQQCQCDKGYKNDPAGNCEDCNECRNECFGEGEQNRCQQRCLNTEGSYLCSCDPGYTLDGNGFTCTDIDECASNPCVNGTCEDRVNAYFCRCEVGFQGQNCDIDINECASNPCLNGQCHDLIGQYQCECDPGWEGRNCQINIDECNSNPCPNGECIDSINRYTCNCDVGWTGTNCLEDIDECVIGTECDHQCINRNRNENQYGYECECYEGFELDGRHRCRDINECTSGTKQCNQHCFNTIGSYRCDCYPGYRLEDDGKICNDIDECSEGTDDCHENANCTNTEGSFNCSCQDGYRGDGKVCREIILFPYGTENGDKELRKNFDINIGWRDVISETLRPPAGFPFWGVFYYSLYFTDNGQFVFIYENDVKYAYPNPYYNGFTTRDKEAMVAIFWDDVDMRNEVGNVFYQVYVDDGTGTLPSEKQEVIDSVNQRINSQSEEHGINEFTANWVVVVTWEEVACFNARYSYRTPNTFQGVLATDGRYGFVLANYKEDEMSWNYRTRRDNFAIIGYNGGRGRFGELYNAQRSAKLNTLEKRYRPDQHDGNTNLRGRWIFRVEDNNENTLNYKQECLNWYNKQPDPRQWNWRLGSCPCSYNQGRRDNSFSIATRPNPYMAGYLPPFYDTEKNRVLLERINRLYGGAFCLQRSFRNSARAGQRCCYRGHGSLVVGYSTTWHSSFMERHYFLSSYSRYRYFDWYTYLKWIEDDLDPRYMCCELSGDQEFCKMYEEKRPAASCRGYRPPRPGWMFGDPHLVTLDGANYTFNGLGEYTLVNTTDEYFRLQGRTDRPEIDGKLTNATIFVAFAAQEDNSSRIQMTLNAEKTDYTILLDGEEFDKETLDEDPTLYNTTDVKLSLKEELVNGTAVRNRTVAAFSSGISISIGVVEEMLDVVFSAPEDFRGQTVGLLGVWNDDPADDFEKRDGSLVMPVKERDYFDFGETWRVSSTESLFKYEDEDGKRWDDYNDLDFEPLFIDEVADPENRQLAIETCGADLECQYDVIATGNADVGKATMSSSSIFQQDADDLANFPPNITAKQVIDAIVGEAVVETVQAIDPDGDCVTFGLLEDVPGGIIEAESSSCPEQATFRWTPQDLSQVRIAYTATDDKEASTTLVVEVRLCDCKNDGLCHFEGEVNGSDVVNDNFKIVPCNCTSGWTGEYCELDYDGCQDSPCYPSVLCFDDRPPSEGFTCGNCPEGLVGDGIKCADFDECFEGRDFNNDTFCNQTCENTVGSYICSCEAGFELHSDQKNCLDIDECDRGIHTCHDQATCYNTYGSYNCFCNDGYTDVDESESSGRNCTNIDECEVERPCDARANCTDTEGSFQCQCWNGFEGNGLIEHCRDIDECSRLLHDCHNTLAYCNNTIGSYMCTCNKGYSGDGKANCDDVDECNDESYPNTCHRSAECTNTVGSYTCACQEGYVGNGYDCIDVDECARATHTCHQDAECENVPGSYTCRCKNGFSGDGRSCQDIDECVVNTHNCDQNANCSNTDGSYSCQCNHGFTGNGLLCNDIDECLNDPCLEDLGLCVNNIGSYECRCKVGYQGDGSATCTDIDECSENNGDCDQHCQNTEGSFVCSCRRGYKLGNDGLSCEDIDECSLNLDDCEQTCTNRQQNDTYPNGYECGCHEGFELDEGGDTCRPTENCTDTICTNSVCFNNGTMDICLCNSGYQRFNETYCEDIDECSDGSHVCDSNGNCINTVPGYNCSCNSGYRLAEDERTCRDIDECQDGLDDCNSQLEICVNQDGGFDCACRAGYTRVNDTCTDIDECADSAVSPCNQYANCTNTPGSYRCQCITGFIGDGVNCDDDDECSRPDTCPDNSECTNYFGTYECDCNNGYVGTSDGACENKDECEDGSHDCDKDNADCTDTEGSYTCMCWSGFAGDGRICLDIDECRSELASCHDDAYCTNTDGSYSCTCNSGYEGNGVDCSDIDECTTGSHNCPADAYCTNVVGSHRCTCNAGYRGDDCEDIDECEENLHNCHADATCTNKPGSFECNCLSGYNGNGTSCTDINECEGLHSCHEKATCTNTKGSYSCQCNGGYIDKEGSSQTGRNCEDLDECLYRAHDCDPDYGECFNIDGSYYCRCKFGYEGDGQNCEDKDECTLKPCPSDRNERCVNQPGNYACECSTGFALDETCKAASTFSCTVVFNGGQGANAWEYHEDLSDTSKHTYHNNKKNIEEELNEVFERSSIQAYYMDSIVLELRNESSRVESSFYVNVDPESGLLPFNISDTFNGEVGTTGRLGKHSYVVDPETFTCSDPDIDRCFDNSDTCDTYATCEDIGSGEYTCECLEGFKDAGTGNAFTGECIDIDECLVDEICDVEMMVCVNTPGSYSCKCRPGYHEIKSGNSIICEGSKMAKGSFTIFDSSEFTPKYSDGFDDPTSYNYRRLERDVINAMDFLYGQHDQTKNDYVRTDVLNFANGSVIVNYALVFNSTAEIDYDNLTLILEEAVSDDTKELKFGGRTLSIKEVKYGEFSSCSDDRYNDCHMNATCTDSTDGQFECKCLDDFEDSSVDFPGRRCEYTVEPGPAETPGGLNLTLIGVLAGVCSAIFLVIVLFIIVKCRKTKPKKDVDQMNVGSFLSATYENRHTERKRWSDGFSSSFDDDGNISVASGRSLSSDEERRMEHIARVFHHAPPINVGMRAKLSKSDIQSSLSNLQQSELTSPYAGPTGTAIGGEEEETVSVTESEHIFKPEIHNINLPEGNYYIPRPRSRISGQFQTSSSFDSEEFAEDEEMNGDRWLRFSDI
ncbi:fibrillin-1-like [Ptychodera flava]|uniref:fibrillin-1-like n=1 Tax=Ptychodera flava TaxID=63121 RepID=UPI00396A7C7E